MCSSAGHRFPPPFMTTQLLWLCPSLTNAEGTWKKAVVSLLKWICDQSEVVVCRQLPGMLGVDSDVGQAIRLYSVLISTNVMGKRCLDLPNAAAPAFKSGMPRDSKRPSSSSSLETLHYLRSQWAGEDQGSAIPSTVMRQATATWEILSAPSARLF